MLTLQLGRSPPPVPPDPWCELPAWGEGGAGIWALLRLRPRAGPVIESRKTSLPKDLYQLQLPAAPFFAEGLLCPRAETGKCPGQESG